MGSFSDANFSDFKNWLDNVFVVLDQCLVHVGWVLESNENNDIVDDLDNEIITEAVIIFFSIWSLISSTDIKVDSSMFFSNLYPIVTVPIS